METTILVDTMGGDHGPIEIIKGSIEAAKSFDNVKLVLLGPEDLLLSELSKLGHPKNITIQHAPDVITMHDEPAKAVRSKKDASIVVGSKMLRDAKAHAIVTPGNTGAATAAGVLLIGRIKGISRPGIMIPFPTRKKVIYLLDAGANADCKPENLLDFGIMASIFLEAVVGIKKPTIGLLSIGEEKTKGNELIKEAFSLFEKTNLNFYGNVEGRDIPKGTTDIVVCDGYTGNVVLKFAEGLIKELFSEIKEISKSSFLTKIGSALMASKLKNLKKRLDAEEHGGALLLGLNNICIICHGNSSAKAIKNAIGVAINAVEAQVVDKISEKMKGKTYLNV